MFKNKNNYGRISLGHMIQLRVTPITMDQQILENWDSCAEKLHILAFPKKWLLTSLFFRPIGSCNTILTLTWKKQNEHLLRPGYYFLLISVSKIKCQCIIITPWYKYYAHVYTFMPVARSARCLDAKFYKTSKIEKNMIPSSISWDFRVQINRKFNSPLFSPLNF